MAKSDLNLITCKGCGMVMVKLSRDVCQKCFQEDEELFVKVRDYIRSNPSSSIIEVAEALGVTEEKINFFIDSGRLERTGANLSHQCQTCQKMIQTGLICQECSDELKKQVSDLKKSISSKKEGPGDSLFKGKK